MLRVQVMAVISNVTAIAEVWLQSERDFHCSEFKTGIY
jgi:hypothetical protein